MSSHLDSDHRSGPRYLEALEVRVEWDETDGTHLVTEGTTENVGPEGTLVQCRGACPKLVAACDSRCKILAARNCW